SAPPLFKEATDSRRIDMSKVPRGIGGYPNADSIPTPKTLTVFNWDNSVPPVPRDEPSPPPESAPAVPRHSIRSLTCGGDEDSGGTFRDVYSQRGQVPRGQAHRDPDPFEDGRPSRGFNQGYNERSQAYAPNPFSPIPTCNSPSGRGGLYQPTGTMGDARSHIHGTTSRLITPSSAAVHTYDGDATSMTASPAASAPPHTTSKVHTCEICQKKFSRPSALVTHKNTHTGERPFVCKYCTEKFTASSNANRHMKAQHSKDLPPTSKPEKQQPYNVCFGKPTVHYQDNVAPGGEVRYWVASKYEDRHQG
ncbi:hypothetical protein EYR40_009703, partial [Pleurotus pulmonarius]